jgi:hypothetical protein
VKTKIISLYTYLPVSAVRKIRKFLLLNRDLREVKKGNVEQHKLSDMELGWKQSTCSVNIRAFFGIQRQNPDLAITEDFGLFSPVLQQ